MRRRTLLGLGAAGGALLGLAGVGAVALYEPAWSDGQLLPAGRRVMRAVAAAVLDGNLPASEADRDAALDHHLSRLTALLQAMPPHTQAEVAEVLALLAMPPLRMTLAGLTSDWDVAAPSAVQAALQSMRTSRWLLRRQLYGALRDLTHAAYFADASTWPLLGYPGPRPIG